MIRRRGCGAATGSLATARDSHTATLLPSGKVLVAGGQLIAVILRLSSAELYDQGLGFDPSWQPLLTAVSPSILHSGSELTASGSLFKGISEASGGNGGREIAGFNACQARSGQEQNLTPPAGLKPVEQEAWLAMARRHGASGGMEFTSFYPARYGEAFVVEGQGARVAVRPVGGTDVAAHIDKGRVIYREAYPETDSVHVVSAGRSEEFLFLQNECAPR